MPSLWWICTNTLLEMQDWKLWSRLQAEQVAKEIKATKFRWGHVCFGQNKHLQWSWDRIGQMQILWHFFEEKYRVGESKHEINQIKSAPETSFGWLCNW